MSDDDEPQLHLASTAKLPESLSFALRFEGGTRVHHADDLIGET